MVIPRSSKNIIKFLAASCGLLAGILLFFSLTVSSSPFKPIVSRNGLDLCVNGRKLAAGFGGPLVLGSDACPGWQSAPPAALVSAQHPYYISLGFGLLFVSFGFQLVDIFCNSK
jgi:hypothetical protein